MHLTNYAINKNSDDFVRDDECGSKRKLATVCSWLEEHGYDVKKMWMNIEVQLVRFRVKILVEFLMNVNIKERCWVAQCMNIH